MENKVSMDFLYTEVSQNINLNVKQNRRFNHSHGCFISDDIS